MRLENSTKGQRFYGMHFYPGIARYEQPGEDPLTVFINESTIRDMSPTFEGCPIFVEHVDGVDDDLDELHGKEDGWVLKSFYNAADGKTWVEFIIVSEKGLTAIKRGYRLSNAYVYKLSNESGEWNGVKYDKTVIGGDFEHLAIVQNPRYNESKIMTPDEFKKYNEQQAIELKRITNSKNKGETKMKFWKRQKIENSVDLDGMYVTGEKSKKDILITKAVEEYDKILNMNGYANGDHMVKVGNDEMSVNDLVKKHMDMMNEMEEAKNADRKKGGEPGEDDVVGDKDSKDPAIDNDDEEEIDKAGAEDVGDRGGDKSLNEEDDEDEKKDKKEMAKNEKAIVDAARKIIAKQKAAKLKNAHLNYVEDETATVSLPQDQVARGKSRYGSGQH